MSRSAAYHHGNLPEALLDAAMTLLERDGHTNLSLREVARAAGVSHNAPYHHFADRVGLLEALSVRAMGDLLDAQQQAATGIADPAERAVRLGMAYIDFAAARPHAFAVVYDPEVCVPGSPSAEMAPLIEANEELLGSTVQALRPSAGQHEAAAYAVGMWGAVHGLAQLVVAGHVALAAARPSLTALAQAVRAAP